MRLVVFLVAFGFIGIATIQTKNTSFLHHLKYLREWRYGFIDSLTCSDNPVQRPQGYAMTLPSFWLLRSWQ